MTKLEEVARQLHRAWHEIGRQIPPPFSTDRFEVERWMLMAQAAIEAMREPTLEMKSAGDTASQMRHPHDPIPIGSVYFAMIDAALAEKT